MINAALGRTRSHLLLPEAINWIKKLERKTNFTQIVNVRKPMGRPHEMFFIMFCKGAKDKR